ncbi:hypothetical protein NF212_01225 [Parasalinivibrio latis]|uniref:WD40 repeat domain-containing protein n=1 Tax=Parasalinivibrio latis TaxID=2952610 RepID=UPI0030E04662
MTRRAQYFFVILTLVTLNACFWTGDEAQRWTIHPEGTTSFSLSRDGRFALLSAKETGIFLWDLQQNQQLADFGPQDPNASAVIVSRISDNNRFAITATSQNFAVWDLAYGKAEGLWSISDGVIRDAALSNNGEKVVLALSNGKALFVDLGNGRRLEFLAHREKVNTVDISANGRFVLSGGNDYNAYLWDTNTGQIIYDFPLEARVTRVVLQRDAKYAFTSDGGNMAAIWDLQTGEKISQLKSILRQQIYSSARFSDDGSRLATGSPSRRVELWETATGDNIGRWQARAQPDTRPPSAVVYDVAIDPTGRVISSTSAGIAQAWIAK